MDTTDSSSFSFEISMVAEIRLSIDAFILDEKHYVLTTLPVFLAFTCDLARSTRCAAAFFGTLASDLGGILCRLVNVFTHTLLLLLQCLLCLCLQLDVG